MYRFSLPNVDRRTKNPQLRQFSFAIEQEATFAELRLMNERITEPSAINNAPLNG